MNGFSEVDVVFVAGPPGAGKTTVTEEYQRNHSGVDQFGAGELAWGVRSGRIASEYSAHIREAVTSESYMPDAIYSGVIQERILKVHDDIDTVLVTGFPHHQGDWDIFLETVRDNGIKLLGSIVLNVGLDTSIKRMQERDIKRGMDASLVTSKVEYATYVERYHKLIGRHAIRLNCYRQAGLKIIPILAESHQEEVKNSFNEAMGILKGGK